MKRSMVFAVGALVAVVTTLAIFIGVANTSPAVQPYGPPIGPRVPQDTGPGEQLLVVLGGLYPTRAEAESANAGMAFGDLQGYYVVPVAQFQGFRDQVGAPGDFALVTVFRTDAGAREFLAMADAFDVPATLLPTRVRSLGGMYAGLGQEAAPDGSGPLLGPVPESMP